MVPLPSYTQHFLTSVLSEHNPSSLPYSKHVKPLIKQHLVSLSNTYPSLRPNTATFTHNDGRSVTLLNSNGTLPIILNQTVTYNIHIIIWLIESYPFHAPLVFVNPTRDMFITRQHPYVNPSGIVSVPYLLNWIYPSCSLVNLVRSLCSCFSFVPPLYYMQRNPNPNYPNYNYDYNPSLKSINNINGFGSSEPLDSDEGDIINALVERVYSDVVGLRESREGEMEGVLCAQAVLREREKEVSNGLRAVQDEKEGLEEKLQMVLMDIDVVGQWVRENEGRLVSLDVDNAIAPLDSLSRQMLECVAVDLAIEDVVYELDKALQDGCVSFDVYLKSVRLQSREQFFYRAISEKIRDVQMQARVTSMAARAKPYGL